MRLTHEHMPVFKHFFDRLVSLNPKQQTSTQSNTVTTDKAIPEGEEEESMRIVTLLCY